MYSADSTTLAEAYESIFQDDKVKNYPQIGQYIEKLWGLREMWALAFRSNLRIRGAHTNNIVEVSFRTLKDRILKRQKATNPVQLIDFVSSVQSSHYRRKIVGMISQPGVVGGNSRCRKALVNSKGIAKDSVKWVEGETYKVNTNAVSYFVDTSIGICSCPVGSSGSACKHQFAVMTHFRKGYAANLPLMSKAERLKYLEVATGKRDIPEGWFDALTDKDSAGNDRIDVNDEEIEGENDDAIVDEGVFASDRTTEDESEEGNLDGSSGVAVCGVSEKTIELEAQLSEFRSFCERMEDMIRNDPDTLLEPLSKYLKRGEGCMKTKTLFASALSTFGIACYPQRRRAKINVQPASIARRKYGGGSSTRQTPGALPKGSTQKRKCVDDVGPALLPQRKKAKLPHSLSAVVSQNTQLGKTHETKMK